MWELPGLLYVLLILLCISLTGTQALSKGEAGEGP